MTSHLSSHHRQAIKKLFDHPAGGNVEWREILALFQNLGTVTEEHNGKIAVTLGPETEIIEAPCGKDVDAQLVVDVRRMLTNAGFAPDGHAPLPDTRHHDHGDGQRGAPS